MSGLDLSISDSMRCKVLSAIPHLSVTSLNKVVQERGGAELGKITNSLLKNDYTKQALKLSFAIIIVNKIEFLPWVKKGKKTEGGG